MNPTSDRYYEVDENGDGTADYTFHNPDVEFSELRSNLVFRWEFKPGSAFYLVWTHSRGSYNLATLPLSDSWDALWKMDARNVLMVKFSYWFST
ncbi:MAG: hypothetical protein GY705_31150 [Bacteroidetes bacterium]|nr:hypothetical protein [Bacteroidota bacterium]